MTLPNLPTRFSAPPPTAEAAPPLPAREVSYAPAESRGGIDWQRVLNALLRFKWIVILSTVLGTAAGVWATRFISPIYSVQATVWIEQLSRRGGYEYDRGPLRAGQFLQPEGWVDLLRSLQVLDRVVRDQRLFLALESPEDAPAMASLQLAERFRPGAYRFTVSDDGLRYVFATRDGMELDRGKLGDSVGARLGLAWVPAAGNIAPGRSVGFQLNTPHDAARLLGDALQVRMDPDGNFLRVVLEGINPRQVTDILNAVVGRYVEVAADLKRRRSTELTEILEGQLHVARGNLERAEAALERFRAATITLPGDRMATTGSGRDPVFGQFFEMQVELDQVRHDRAEIEQLIAQSNSDSGRYIGALEAIGPVQRSSDLSQALKELAAKQADARSLRYKYGDEWPPLQRLNSEIATLERQTVPTLARGVVRELKVREAHLDQRLATRSGTLRQIPERALDEARLQRAVALTEDLYKSLQQRYDEARIEEASSTPDVRVLDAAVMPMEPSKNSAPRIVLLAFVGSLGLATCGVVLLDRIDPRLNYPEQVSRDLGLSILGAVPHIKARAGGYRLSREEASEVVEALRGVCLNLVYAHGTTGPLLVTMTSPGAGDGKSFLSANLALTFADGGHRTLLIDGDLRRGVLHRRFQVQRRPGLTDYLRGETPVEKLVATTPYPSLSFVPAGSRTHSAPELLGSPAMVRLFEQIRARYDVIVVDSPPLSGGVDPYILAALTGNLVVVLRTGFSHRELAAAKLEMLARLPVRLLGAVLNDVPPGGSYQYYSYYLPGYEGVEEEAKDRKRPGLV
ncbi:MAG: polysaccharide biosynthesis tyrosine autokinase [Gemmatimonadetes bacterium]|nr:polysaccharide biosynthesis tyrosine autokinase [Gemmatimonadota bacterium]